MSAQPSASSPQPSAPAAYPGPGMREFVALMAALMATNALAIDAMLPALPAIGAALDVAEENRRQLVITAYLLGFGGAQLFYGPLSDRLGRKAILTISLGLYAVFALLSGIAASFELLLGARVLQGMAAAGTRVLVVSIVRDRFHGAAMARVMSLVFIVFMIVPVLAPAFGQAVLLVAPWRFIFIGLGVYAAAVLAWALIRLPETHPPEKRRALSLAKLREAFAITLSHRLSIGNTIALTLVMGGLFGFINSIQQIVFDVFGRPELMAAIFACVALPMAASSYLNARIVERHGSRRLMLIALAGFSAAAGLHLAVAALIGETLVSFVAMQALTMVCFGLISANLGAIAMQPLGHIAGTASSVQGLITTIGGALIGLAIGQAFDGTTLPLLTGFTLCGLAAFAVALWANRKAVAGA
ncbi:multidrug effflux MFS transporter [Allosphingosinicella indica]|uniref:Bcr/CflA family efflux transporter n=1 Tax=Allosphingosinicella indica TaxID=941907 RepID=A0A1X7GXM2_9SPHN|nr:multidrug effflux MFS transporter [Allosphingosinicella indica]SMF76319.1 MFS transporter, DHA1 family, bicyclomycin/chloramphenicol resistance protein [Allosphingosinicella indica]